MIQLPRYPIYVPSKGRSDRCSTVRFLLRDGVPFRLVVEPQELDAYLAIEGVTPDMVLTLPFRDRGLHAARCWIKDHSTAAGDARHWQLDDNILGMWRRFRARKIPCHAAPAFRAVEDFTDRYENVAVAGHNYYMFAVNKQAMPPFYLNVHVYSSTLVLNALPHRWRDPLNDDTDFCLQVLADGWCTVLFNAFLAWKMTTMSVKGGNTQEWYAGDGRLRMARSLERRWPGVVSVTRRFRRPQHVVKHAWGKFDTPLRRRADVDFDRLPPVDEMGMDLKQVKPIKSPAVRSMLRAARARG